jgi:DNA-binding transcriptional LysR family regulator
MKQHFENYFASAPVTRPRSVIETDSISFALRLIQQYGCLAFMPLGHAGILDPGQFVDIEIDGLTWSRGIGVFYRDRPHHPPALARVVEVLRAHFAASSNEARGTCYLPTR